MLKVSHFIGRVDSAKKKDHLKLVYYLAGSIWCSFYLGEVTLQLSCVYTPSTVHTYLFHFQKKGKSVRAELVVRAHVCFLHQTKIIFFNFLLWCGQLKQQPGAFLVLVDLLGSFIWVQAHSSKLRGLRSTKCSSKMLQICYISYRYI